MQKKVKTISFKGQNIYVGIDVHLKSWTVTIIVGLITHKSFSQDPSAELLAAYLCRNFPEGNYFSVYEAGFCGFSVHRQLESNGITNLVVNPADIPTTDKERSQKEDRRDSRKLAKSLKNGELTGIYIMSSQQEELRSLVRYRKTTMKEICRHKNRIKSFLYLKGIHIPKQLNTASKYWSASFTKWLKQLELTTEYGHMVLNQTIETAEFLRGKLLKVNREFRQLEKRSQYTEDLKQLRSIPGVGLIVAMTFLSELDNIKRFNNLDKLCSFVGLIPSTHSSGEKEVAANITRRTNKPLRAAIVESSWVAIRYDPALSLKYNQLRSRMEPNQAIIRLANNMLNRIRYVLLNHKDYVCSVVE